MSNPTLKVKVLPRFPSSVTVQSPIVLDQTGGNYDFSFDMSVVNDSFADTFMTEDSINAVSNKTLDNTNVITVKDANFTLQDDGDTTKQLQFQLSGITTATTRTWTIPDVNDTFVGKTTTDTFTGVKTFGAAGNVGKLVVAGTTSGSTILNATAIASGTLTLPAATDTLVGKATTDILTNKTFDTAGAGNVFKINGTAITGNTGTTNNVLASGPTMSSVTLTGTTSAQTITSSAGITSNSATAGIGYATGAGGTVTQGTSKSTTVVLNTATGQITMNGAALGASVTVSFTLTNSAIAAGDVLVLNHVANGTAGVYLMTAQAGSGSALIVVRNISGGSLSEAIVIGFAVIKGATS